MKTTKKVSVKKVVHQPFIELVSRLNFYYKDIQSGSRYFSELYKANSEEEIKHLMKKRLIGIIDDYFLPVSQDFTPVKQLSKRKATQIFNKEKLVQLLIKEFGSRELLVRYIINES